MADQIFPPEIPKEGDPIVVIRNPERRHHDVLAWVDFRASNCDGDIVLHLRDDLGRAIDEHIIYSPKQREINRWRFFRPGPGSYCTTVKIR
jgi:hypothetical protein